MLQKFFQIKIVAAFLLVCGFSSAHATYVVGGPSAGQQTLAPYGSYKWQGGTHLAGFRAALENPNNFGPAGTVNETIDVVDVDMANNDMSGLDGFIAPWWAVADSNPYHQKVVDFFMAGGDLWLLQDSSGRDGIGALLGIPTVGQTSITPVSGTAPLFDGPFGIANTVNQGGGEEGYINRQHVLNKNGTIVATNTEDQVIAAVWKPGEFAAGSGSLIVVADIDMFTTKANFNTMNDNAIFTLNAFVFLATSTNPNTVPEPAPLALLGMGLIGVVVMRRRRS